MDNQETWKTCYISSKYKISSLGRLLNNKTNNIIKPQIKKNKQKGTISQIYELYDYYAFDNKKGRRSIPVAKLVYNTFIDKTNKMPVQHKDHNNLNNCLDNLTLEQYQPEKLTTDQLISRIHDKLGKDYQVINNKNLDSKSTIILKHKCGYKFKRKVASILYGNNLNCPYCTDKGIGNNYDEVTYNHWIEVYSNNRFSLISSYEGYNKSVVIKDNFRNHSFHTIAQLFMKRVKNKATFRCCSICNEKENILNLKINSRYNRIKDAYKQGFKIDRVIPDHNNKILITCLKCHRSFLKSMASIHQSGFVCPYDKPFPFINHTLYEARIIQFITKLRIYFPKLKHISKRVYLKHGIPTLRVYVNKDSNKQFRHKAFIFLNKDGLLQSNYYEYNIKRRNTALSCIKELNKLKEFSIRGDTVIMNPYQKVNFYHNNCHKIFTAHLSDLINNNHGCTFCDKSHGERAIENWLIKNNIKFKSQLRIIDCRYRNPLPFDFAIYKNKTLLGLIEYQGEQHYKEIFTWDKKADLKLRKLRDNIKFNYCLNNKIPLLRIPFNHKKPLKAILGTFYREILKV